MLTRTFDTLLAEHIASHRQLAMVSGARQVGKTTVCRGLASDHSYLNWDNQDDRRIILSGPSAVAEHVGLARLAATRAVVVFDELHKYRRWKNFLKGFFDVYADRAAILVTGSGRMDVFRRGGDSLMGRYFQYRMHPLSIGELLAPAVSDELLRPPAPLAASEMQALWDHGGFPEPFVKRTTRFSNLWRAQRTQLLVREDVRELSPIQDLARLESLVALLAERSGAPLVYSNLARDLQVSVDTVRRWVGILTFLGHGFLVKPWFKNVTKSLRKEPKWFNADWASVGDPGARAETLVACHLQKSADGWTDRGLGKFELRYLRDKEKREVDFAMIRDGKPWFLVEVKLADTTLHPPLRHFQAQTKAPHAFQVVWQQPFVHADPFSRHDPTIVAAHTLLSQLL